MAEPVRISLLRSLGQSRSIASRLTFWYALLSVVLIASAGSVMYWMLADRLRQEDDRVISSRIAELRAILLVHSSNSATFLEDIQREAALLPGTYVRVLDSKAAIVAQTTAAEMAFRFRQARGTNPQVQPDEHGEDLYSDDGKTYRFMEAHFASGSGFTVQVAMDRSREEALLAAYRHALWLAVSAVLFIAVSAGYLIARREMRPMSQLASIVAELSTAHLNRRVGDTPWPLELRPLAMNFDQLLSHLEESFTHMERFSADIAHELRTPLHILQGEAELALAKTRSNEDYRACIESAAEEYQRLTRMVDALLFLARTEQPDTQLNKQMLDLESEIATICNFYQAMADEQGVVLIVRARGTVMADSGLLRRALGNLIANALRHSVDGGQIIVEMKGTAREQVEIVVSDSGDGIAPSDLPHVFDRFYRADSARSRQGTGTGLGLAIVKSIMLLHGGTASIRSDLHHGTSVTLCFPASTL